MGTAWLCNISFQAPTPARKCEIIYCLLCGEDGWVDEPDVRSRDYQKISRIDWQPTFFSYNCYKVSLTRGALLSVTYYTVLPQRIILEFESVV